MNAKRDFYIEMNKRRREVLLSPIKDRNCVSTALYLVGERNSDDYLHTFEAEDILEGAQESPKPKLGSLLAVYDELSFMSHLAVIVQENPLLVATRNGIGKPLLKSQLFEEMMLKGGYINNSKKIKFLIPSKLQKILEMEAQQ